MTASRRSGKRRRTEPTEARALVVATAPAPSCFVIGPIGNKFAPVGSVDRDRYEHALETFENVILPACSAHGLLPVRADHIATPGEITSQVFTALRDSDVVIADLTGGNPNVMYELGLRHTRHRITVQIGEYGHLPFDVAAIRTIQFARTPLGLIEGRKQLEQTLSLSLRGQYDPVTATRLWADLPSQQPASEAVLPPSLPVPEAPGLVDILAEMEDALPRVAGHMQELTEVGQKLGELGEDASTRLHDSDASGGGFKGRQAVALSLAAELLPLADKMERVVAEMTPHFEATSAGLRTIATMIQAGSREEAGQVPPVFGELADLLPGAIASSNSLATVYSGFTGLSAHLRSPARRIADALTRVSEAIQPLMQAADDVRVAAARASRPASG